ncbi:MAG: hypothetical protein KQI78_25325 [Deltaproteobacteria bacterium]|nr:hypothetical protein [Deltaproteobacteria bacterium]
MITPYNGGVPSVNLADSSIPECRIPIPNGCYKSISLQADRHNTALSIRHPRPQPKEFSAHFRKNKLKILFCFSTYPRLLIITLQSQKFNRQTVTFPPAWQIISALAV